VGDYTLKVKTLLAGDTNPSNDEKTKDILVGESHHLPPGTYVIDETEKADTIITITVSNETNVFISLSSRMPGDLPSPYVPTGPCVDISVDDEDNVVWPIYIQIFYTEDDCAKWDLTEDQIKGMFYWNGHQWKLYDETGVDTHDITIGNKSYAGYVWAYAYKGQLSPKVPGGTDITPPTTWYTPKTKHFSPGSLITIHGRDDGVWYKIYYRIDDGDIHVGKENRDVYAHAPMEGIHKLEYWGVDAWGNVEQHHTVTFRVSYRYPQTRIAFEGYHEFVDTHWEIAPDTLVFFEVDDGGRGLQGTYYKIDSGEWKLFTAPFTLSEAEHWVYYYSIDSYGCREDTVASYVVVKSTNQAPTTTCTLNPSMPNGNNGWYRNEVTVTLTAKDPEEDDVTIYYKIDGDEWGIYTEPFIVGDGIHKVYYHAIDNHGNEEGIKAKELKIDIYAPKISVNRPSNALYIFDREILPLPGDKPVIIGKITIDATIEDTATSGIDNVFLYMDDGLKKTFDGNIEYTLDETLFGLHTMKIVAYDVAGNEAKNEMDIIIYNINLRG